MSESKVPMPADGQDSKPVHSDGVSDTDTNRRNGGGESGGGGYDRNHGDAAKSGGPDVPTG